MVYEIEQLANFKEWHRGLKDLPARFAIGRRIERAFLGNLGDHKALGGGLGELRIDVSGGYRVYFVLRHQRLIILLAGGDKSTQTSDIQKARRLAKEIRT
ncbi:type II toxin-antitoxin system RelE/ParE family toxin [Pseudomonas reidholzensis]|uniref:type II toxin-antitoxin system RelE/ParE family toxin n=1 Tax=Pseudomonas reidholzensis TaxID=1785162 RepID=UPI0039F10C28